MSKREELPIHVPEEVSSTCIDNPPLNPLEPTLEYLLEVVLHERFNTLKARMMNLAESTIVETRQCSAVKGLIKDFLNQAYYSCVREIAQRVEDCKNSNFPGKTRGQIMGLEAKSLDDVLVD